MDGGSENLIHYLNSNHLPCPAMLWMTTTLPLPFSVFSLSGSSDHMDGGDAGVEGEAITGDECTALGCGETKKGLCASNGGVEMYE